MVLSSNFATLSLGLLATAVTSVHGHGYMLYPYPYFPYGGDITTYAATIDGPSTLTCPSNGSFSSSPDINVASFTEAFNAQTTYKTLKDLIVGTATVVTSDATLTCGYTDPDSQETADELPAYVTWAHTSTEGFTSSHEGPCEVWCDNTRVMQNDNCPSTYTTAPALLPYDQTVCEEASVLTFYWLALHSSTWQAYINCAKLSGDVSSTAASAYTGSDYTESSGTTASTTTTSASSATTTASSTASATTSTAASTAAEATDSASAATTTASSAASAETETTTSTTTSSTGSSTATTTASSTGSSAAEDTTATTTTSTTSSSAGSSAAADATTTTTAASSTGTSAEEDTTATTTTTTDGSSKCNVRRRRRN